MVDNSFLEHIEAIVSPRSVAVIGASNKKDSVGNAVIKNLVDANYSGVLYLINPSSSEILGIQCYSNVQNIEGPVDLAIVIVPSDAVPQVIEECGKKGVKGAVIISAGFKEAGELGKKLENQVIEIAKKYGVRLLGPNCVGFLNADPKISLNASFVKRMPKFGNVSLVSQSGAICGAMLEYAKIKEIGFSKVFSLGNKADLNENDVLTYLANDSSTKVILMYVEDLNDAKNFIKITSCITKNGPKSKPILAMKVGQSPVGNKAIASHTGALAGSHEAYDAIFKQAGIIKVETLEQLFDYALAFSYQPIPLDGGAVIVSNAGGPAAITADSSLRYGLKLAKLSESTLVELKKILPKNAMMINPIDMIGDADHLRYQKALECVLKDNDVNSAIVISTPQLMLNLKALAEVIVETSKKFKDKPILSCITGFMENEDAVRILDENGIPQYAFPESATDALAMMQKYRSIIQRPSEKVERYTVDTKTVQDVVDRYRQAGKNYISGPDAMAILKAYGVPVVEPILVTNIDECVVISRRIGFPVVLKISSPDIIHKVDVGGVETNIQNENEVRERFTKILENVKNKKPTAKILGLVVEKFVSGGKEVIIGAKHDPQFGPLLMFGTGGIYVNIFGDVSFCLAPITKSDAIEMIESTKASKILAGTRGEKPSDMASIIDCLQRASQLVTDFSNILEIDINPLLVFEEGKGCIAVDARLVISNATF